MTEPMSLIDALLFGIVEGLTEFLPVSSTGHLILTSAWLGYGPANEGVEAFLVVIQAGALLAVLGRYREAVGSMLRGLAGRDHAGRRLLTLLILGFVPIVPVALLLADNIKQHLFAPIPVGLALGIGGVAMMVMDRRARMRGPASSGDPEGGEAQDASFADLTIRGALIIGLVQCIALWPGMSRSMVTILAGLFVGLRPRAAAEFSFLLALPTLGAATAYDLFRHGPQILEVAGFAGLAVGFVASCVVAALAIHTFLRILAMSGLAPFGVYRIALAFVIFLVW